MELDRPEEGKRSLLLFYSYAHSDTLFRDELEKHLSILQRQGTITGWHDRQITAGSYWAKDINTYLDTASIILLLVSPDFLASDYCYSIEMQRALQRHKSDEALVIPVVLRPCDWKHAPLADLQCLPRNSQPITTWRNRDEAYLDVVQGIRAAISHIEAQSSLTPQPNAPIKEKPDPETRPNKDYWEEGGALGELVGSMVRKKQWEQAESTARNIVNSQQRSLTLHKLVGAMIQSEMWSRAEAVAFSIENEQYKRKALFELANKLIEMQQWERAKSITYTIEYPMDRAQLLRSLSRAIADDEVLGHQAQILAYDSDRTLPQYTASLPPTNATVISPSSKPNVHSSRRTSGCLAPLVALLIIVGTLLSLYSQKNLPAAIFILSWVIVGIASIFLIIRIISFIRDL